MGGSAYTAQVKESISPWASGVETDSLTSVTPPAFSFGGPEQAASRETAVRAAVAAAATGLSRPRRPRTRLPVRGGVVVIVALSIP